MNHEKSAVAFRRVEKHILGGVNTSLRRIEPALATIEKLEDGQIYDRLFKLGRMISDGTDAAAAEVGVKTCASYFGSIFATYFTSGPMIIYNDVLRNDAEAFVRFRRSLIERGVFMLPVNAKRSFISAAHTEQDIRETIEKSRSPSKLRDCS